MLVYTWNSLSLNLEGYYYLLFEVHLKWHSRQLLKPACPKARDPQQENPRQWEALAARQGAHLPPTPVQQQRPSKAMKKEHYCFLNDIPLTKSSWASTLNPTPENVVPSLSLGSYRALLVLMWCSWHKTLSHSITVTTHRITFCLSSKEFLNSIFLSLKPSTHTHTHTERSPNVLITLSTVQKAL